jgi:hypothetical protein
MAAVAASKRAPARRSSGKSLTRSRQREVNQYAAAIAAAFIPYASWRISHDEANRAGWNPVETSTFDPRWLLVAASLAYSAPSIYKWAKGWAEPPGRRDKFSVKAAGFTALLEGVMVASQKRDISYGGLAILVALNAIAAYSNAGKS